MNIVRFNNLNNYLNQKYPRRYNHPVSNGNPDFVIMDISYLFYYWPNTEFFKRFTLYVLLETITSVSMEEDYDPILWDTISSYFNEEEEKNFDFCSLSFYLETIIESFYNELCLITSKATDSYIFHSWVDGNSIMLKKE